MGRIPPKQPTPDEIERGEREGEYLDPAIGKMRYFARTQSGHTWGWDDPTTERLDGGQVHPAIMPWE